MEMIENILLIVSMCMFPPLTDKVVCREVYHLHMDAPAEMLDCVTLGETWRRDYGEVRLTFACFRNSRPGNSPVESYPK